MLILKGIQAVTDEEVIMHVISLVMHYSLTFVIFLKKS